MAEQANEEQQGGGEHPAEKRDKSTIQFVYLDLDEAAGIAAGVHASGGTSCQMDQLAGHLNVKADTGSFRLRLGTSRVFGFITFAGQTVSLTSLGIRVCDPQQEAAAKAEAFLNVPLYRQIYEQFKGGILPNQQGLESAIVNLGVAPKQKTTARQVFARSAQQAGFFQYGNNRLVPPPIRGAGTASGSPDPAITIPPELPKDKPPFGNGGGGGGDSGGIDCDPAILGLIKRLPKPDGDFPLEKQARWLLAVSHAFAVVYPAKEDDGRSLKIEIVKD